VVIRRRIFTANDIEINGLVIATAFLVAATTAVTQTSSSAHSSSPLLPTVPDET
jgi:hypothetical protein